MQHDNYNVVLFFHQLPRPRTFTLIMTFNNNIVWKQILWMALLTSMLVIVTTTATTATAATYATTIREDTKNTQASSSLPSPLRRPRRRRRRPQLRFQWTANLNSTTGIATSLEASQLPWMTAASRNDIINGHARNNASRSRWQLFNTKNKRITTAAREGKEEEEIIAATIFHQISRQILSTYPTWLCSRWISFGLLRAVSPGRITSNTTPTTTTTATTATAATATSTSIQLRLFHLPLLNFGPCSYKFHKMNTNNNNKNGGHISIDNSNPLSWGKEKSNKTMINKKRHINWSVEEEKDDEEIYYEAKCIYPIVGGILARSGHNNNNLNKTNEDRKNGKKIYSNKQNTITNDGSNMNNYSLGWIEFTMRMVISTTNCNKKKKDCNDNNTYFTSSTTKQQQHQQPPFNKFINTVWKYNRNDSIIFTSALENYQPSLAISKFNVVKTLTGLIITPLPRSTTTTAKPQIRNRQAAAAAAKAEATSPKSIKTIIVPFYRKWFYMSTQSLIHAHVMRRFHGHCYHEFLHVSHS